MTTCVFLSLRWYCASRVENVSIAGIFCDFFSEGHPAFISAAAVPKATVDRRPGTHEPYKMIAFAGIFGMLEIRLAKVWLNPTCCKFRLKLVV